MALSTDRPSAVVVGQTGPLAGSEQEPELRRRSDVQAPLAVGLVHRANTDVCGQSTAIDQQAELRKGGAIGEQARIAELSLLALGDRELLEVRGLLRTRIKKGFAIEGAEIAALPAYVGMPDASIKGDALVLDTGGTNMRAARVRLDGASSKILEGPATRLVPGRGDSITGEQFFGAHRELVEELGGDVSKLPIGYVFSFGSEVLPDGDAKLIRWAKGIDVPGVEGTRVGRGLREAMAAGGIEPGEVSVLNDTVAALLGGAAAHAGEGFSDFIGLIAGTGHNIASFVEAEDLKKVQGWSGRMAVNLETGNFKPPHLTRWDAAIDASESPGHNRFEKAVSGRYLPFLFQQIVPELPGFDPNAGSRVLSDLRDDETQSELVRTAASLILDRSADLVAAALAAVVDLSPAKEGTIGIVAEGGLFWRIPGYSDRVEKTLDRLLAGSRVKVQILRLDDANLYGAAGAALLKAAQSTTS